MAGEEEVADELPTKPFGLILKRKLNEIEAEVFEVTSRASRTTRSRHPSACMFKYLVMFSSENYRFAENRRDNF